MTTKFPEALAIAQTLIPQFGVKATISSPVNVIEGQQVDGDNTVLEDYQTDVVLINDYYTRQTGYVRSDSVRFIMANTGNREPRSGDVLTLSTTGRNYIVQTVSALRPDGVALIWDVIAADG